MRYALLVDMGPLFIGDVEACNEFWGPTLHACKSPCYLQAVGGPQEPGSNLYLAAEIKNNLFLNLIDPAKPLFKAESFYRAMKFLDSVDHPLIHCNQGLSRAPSIALLWLNKRGYIPGNTFDQAKEGFMYPYRPGQGIAAFLRANWATLDYTRTN